MPKAGAGVSAIGRKLIPVKADTWYRMSFLFRNTVGNGEIKYGFQESEDTETVQTKYYSWKRRALPLNIKEWTRFSTDFRMARGTKAVRLWFWASSVSDGEVCFDDISLEEVTHVTPPVSICPYDAAATYTDIPTRQAYTDPAEHKDG